MRFDVIQDQDQSQKQKIYNDAINSIKEQIFRDPESSTYYVHVTMFFSDFLMEKLKFNGFECEFTDNSKTCIQISLPCTLDNENQNLNLNQNVEVTIDQTNNYEQINNYNPWEAVFKDDDYTLQRYLECNGDIDIMKKNNITLLMEAARNGSTKCIETLLLYDVDITKTDIYGVNALMYAAKNYYTCCLNVMLEYIKEKSDIDFNIVDTIDYDGSTMLMYTVYYDDIECTKLLLELGCDVNIQNNFSWTALLYAIEADSVESVKLLLKAGANVNTGDCMGKTPIMYAFEYGEHENVKMLLNESDIDLSIKDNEGKHTIMYAFTCPNPDCIKLLF